MIPEIVLVFDVIRMAGITYHDVKVNHTIKSTAFSNPAIDGLALLFPFFCVVTGENCIGIGGQRSAENAYTMGVSTVDELTHAGRDIVGRHCLLMVIGTARVPNIIDGFHQYHRTNTWH